MPRSHRFHALWGGERPLWRGEGRFFQRFDCRDLPDLRRRGEVYPNLYEKAANLLYFETKNHSFLDGNKRIAATLFLYFLDRNGALFTAADKIIDDSTLVAITIMIAESLPE